MWGLYAYNVKCWMIINDDLEKKWKEAVLGKKGKVVPVFN
jgi:hypothetical protein